MGKKHDQIVRSLNKKKIIELFAENIFGKVGVWAPTSINDFVNNGSKDLKLSSIGEICSFPWVDIFQPESFEEIEKINGLTFKNLREKLKEDKVRIIKKSVYDSIEISRSVEVPIIKGEGQYRTTKGYLDIVVRMKTVQEGIFGCYQERDKKQLIIEVKKEKDFEDTGSIIRQMNEYKEYFKSDHGALFIIYCDETIPRGSIEMLEEEGYIVVDKTHNTLEQKKESGNEE